MIHPILDFAARSWGGNGGVLKYWDGSKWVRWKLLRHNGTAFQQVNLKINQFGVWSSVDVSGVPYSYRLSVGHNSDGSHGCRSAYNFNLLNMTFTLRPGTMLEKPDGTPALADGTVVSMSPDNSIVVLSRWGGTDGLGWVWIYSRDCDDLTYCGLLSDNPSDNPAVFAWSPDSQYLAVCFDSGSRYLSIYKRNGYTLTKLTSTDASWYCYDAAWDPSGTYLAVTPCNASSPWLNIYKRVGDTITKLSSIPSGASRYGYVAWHPSGTYLACHGSDETAQTIAFAWIKRTGDSFATLTNPTDIGQSYSNIGPICWDYTGTFLITGGRTTPSSTPRVYIKTGDSLELTTNQLYFDNVETNGNYGGAWWSPDHLFLVVLARSASTGLGLILYKKHGNILREADGIWDYQDVTSYWKGFWWTEGIDKRAPMHRIYGGTSAVTTSAFGYLLDTANDYMRRIEVPGITSSSMRISKTGIYAAAGGTGDTACIMYKRDDFIFQNISSLSNFTLTGEAPNVFTWTQDDAYVAMPGSSLPGVFIYKRNGDVFTKLTTPSLGYNAISVGWRRVVGANYYLIVVYSDLTNYKIRLLRVNDTTVTDLGALPAIGYNAPVVAWANQNDYLVLSGTNSAGNASYFSWWSFDEGTETFTQLSNPATVPNRTPTYRVASWSPDDTYLLTHGDATNKQYLYKRTGSTLALVSTSNWSPTLTQEAYDIAWAPDSTYVVLGLAYNDQLWVYKRSGDSFSRISQPDYQASAWGFRVNYLVA